MSGISVGCGLRYGEAVDDDEDSAGRWNAAVRDVEAAEERDVLRLPERLSSSASALWSEASSGISKGSFFEPPAMVQRKGGSLRCNGGKME